MRIAVIGAGVSGNVCAGMLQSQHSVVLYDVRSTPGGHTCTVDVKAFGQHYAVDTGFMVYNDRTYPNFVQLLKLLDIEGQRSDMSFSVRCDRSRIEYQGSSLNGLFAQRSNLLRPRFYRMLAEIIRFNRLARAVRNQLDDRLTVGELLERNGFADDFRNLYLLPMTAAIWSAAPDAIRAMPAKFLIQFCHNHGLLQLKDRPQWKTIPGGARRYVDRLLAPLAPHQLRLSTPVRWVRRFDWGIHIGTDVGIERFDAVIFACHADQALSILGDEATCQERSVLSRFPYQKNVAILHTDHRALPRRTNAWASWNYRVGNDPTQAVSVTYDVNRLQRLGAPRPICVTLNGQRLIDPDTIMAEMTYEHPVFGKDTLAAQDQRELLDGQRHTYYCGAYWGYGFHEDGVRSALAVCKNFSPVERLLSSWKAVSTEDTCDTAVSNR